MPERSIVISRHNSYWDPVIFALIDLRLKPLGNHYWFHSGPYSWLVRHARALPNDLIGLCRALEHLRRDGIVWMAPAGYVVSSGGREVRMGAYRLARATESWLVPATVLGLAELPTLRIPTGLRRHHLTVTLGAPRRLLPAMTEQACHQAWTEVLREAGIATAAQAATRGLER